MEAELISREIYILDFLWLKSSNATRKHGRTTLKLRVVRITVEMNSANKKQPRSSGSCHMFV